MPIPTVNVFCPVMDQNGAPVAGAVIMAVLDRPEVYQGYVVPRQVEVVADANGEAILRLFPNALGAEGSRYKLRVTDPKNGHITRLMATIPAVDCNLWQVANLPSMPQKTEAQVAQDEALGTLQGYIHRVEEGEAKISALESVITTMAGNAAASAALAEASEGVATTMAGNAAASAALAEAIKDDAETIRDAAQAEADKAAAVVASLSPGVQGHIPKPIFHWNCADAPLLHPKATFTRASIGSFFDSTGFLRYANAGVPRYNHDPLTGICKGLLIEPATTFLDTYSDQFDNAAWTKLRVSVIPNAAVSPDGTTTADKLVEDTTTNSSHVIYRSITIATNTTYICSVIAEQAERSILAIMSNDGISNTTVYFNLANGTVGTKTGTGIGTIKHVGGGRYICTLLVNIQSGSNAAFQIYLANGDNSSVYSGDGTSGLYIWGAKLYAGSSPVSSLPTGWETTSTTSNSIGTGSKTFSVTTDSGTAGKTLPAGATVRVWQTSNPANYMTGTVTSHTGTSLIINATASGGSGTGVTDWTIQAGASVVRAADLCRVDTTKLLDGAGNALWGGTEGTIVVDFTLGTQLSNVRAVSLHSGTTSDCIYIGVLANGQLVSRSTVSGTAESYLFHGVPVANTRYKIAFAFAVNNQASSCNGGPVVTDSSCGVPSTTTLEIGSLISTLQLNGTIRSLQLYNRRLDNACLQALSTI